jgi:hypothetical protein
MSGILDAITAAGQLFGGYGVVTLGPVQLTGSMLPASISIGGSQALTVHKLPGGTRIIDAMGQDDSTIGWSALLDTAEASTTARLLDKVRRSGTAITLAWDVYSYQVILSKFTCETRLVPPMKYSLELTVVNDSTLVTGITPTSLALQLAGDLTTGNVLGALSTVSQGLVGNTVGTAQTAAAATGATTYGTGSYNAAVGAVASAQTAITGAVTYANGVLAPLGTNIGAVSAAAPAALDVAGLAGQFTQAVTAAGDLANLSAAQGYVARAGQNLGRASA